MYLVYIPKSSYVASGMPPSDRVSEKRTQPKETETDIHCTMVRTSMRSTSCGRLGEDDTVLLHTRRITGSVNEVQCRAKSFIGAQL